jgi:hypothetical protein
MLLGFSTSDRSVSRIDYSTLILLSDLKSATPPSRFNRGQEALNSALARLEFLRQFDDGWDGYSAEAPAVLAIATAKRAVQRAIGRFLLPAFILPSAEGGIGIGFRSGTRYADVECFNSGEILALTSFGDRTEPRVWEVDDTVTSLDATFEVIGEHLGQTNSAAVTS